MPQTEIGDCNGFQERLNNYARFKHKIIARLYQELKGDIPIIGSGGVDSVENAQQKNSGRCRIIKQIYSGLIYHGPKLCRN
ncbi:hypothetical protein INT80_01460 [Gallibacterium anatis]|uniref:Dihydroorotate dehydrogenase catalytic domain-containing protein n=1 Tax=Gallibacterium anatis TaxID=750 RepID=A0A930Y4Q4_9PAST|nr:hypothetical protein [Gallibacterium anatis]